MSTGRGAVTAVAVATAVTATLAGAVASLWAVHGDHPLTATALNSAVLLAFAVVGAVVASARPENKVGWFMLLGGVTWSLGGAAVDVARHGIVDHPGSVAGASALAVAGAGTRSVGWYLITLAVPAYFPDGTLPPGRWQRLRPLLVVILVAGVLDPLTDPPADLTDFGSWVNPAAPHGLWQLLSTAAFLAHIPTSLVATVAVVVLQVRRWRLGTVVERRQVQLLAAAAALPVVAVPIAFAGAGGWAFDVAALPLPFAIGVAVLTRGLYDLRTAANRGLVWLTLSAVVAGTYALVIVGVGSVVHVDRQAAWLPWLAAAVVAVSFAPVRDALQRGVNRLTYGRWDEPYDVLATLGSRLEASTAVTALLADMTAELQALGLREPGLFDAGGTLLAGSASDGHDAEVPLSAFGERVGSLRYRRPATPLRARDRQLLDDLAGLLGGVLHAQQLETDVRRGRESLVLTREEERRRLRRDLHDGLGPALAGHLLRLDLIRSRAGHDTSVRAELDALGEDLRSTVHEVRRVVEGLRPPALDELGLAGALTEATARLTAGTALELELRVDDLPVLPAAVEVAAYRIVTEAVTNVVRHAQASRCEVDLQVRGNALHVVVTDDGTGEPPADRRGGHGLHTMRERAEELQGTCRIRHGEGTQVVALLPLAGRRSREGAT
jgi:signal transduction histidine kinase